MRLKYNSRVYMRRLTKLDRQLTKAIDCASFIDGHHARTFEAMREDVQTIMRSYIGQIYGSDQHNKSPGV